MAKLFRPSSLLLLATALAPASPTAQRPVFVVDASGGAGSHFIDLPAAVAAVPDGSVLIVRPGTYTPFSVSGKGLSIVGEDAKLVILSDGQLSIGGTNPSQTFLLKNLTLTAQLGWGAGVQVSVQSAAGAVVWESIQLATARLSGDVSYYVYCPERQCAVQQLFFLTVRALCETYRSPHLCARQPASHRPQHDRRNALPATRHSGRACPAIVEMSRGRP